MGLSLSCNREQTSALSPLSSLPTPELADEGKEQNELKFESPEDATKALECALDMMRRLPPQQIEKNLIGLVDLVPELCEDLLSEVHQPLKVAKDKENAREYLLCDYNRDVDSYRSPWSNTYDPPLDDGSMPSERLRNLEIEANRAFDQYRDLYYNKGGVSSVYLWDLDYGFAGVTLFKKTIDGNENANGCWDSIHVFEVEEKDDCIVQYKLTSTVMVWLETNKSGSGLLNTGGNLTRRDEKEAKINEDLEHIANIGQMIEDLENKILNTVNEINFSMTKDIISSMRTIQGADVPKSGHNVRASCIPNMGLQSALNRDLMQAFRRRNLSTEM